MCRYAKNTESVCGLTATAGRVWIRPWVQGKVQHPAGQDAIPLLHRYYSWVYISKERNVDTQTHSESIVVSFVSNSCVIWFHSPCVCFLSLSFFHHKVHHPPCMTNSSQLQYEQVTISPVILPFSHRSSLLVCLLILVLSIEGVVYPQMEILSLLSHHSVLARSSKVNCIKK